MALAVTVRFDFQDETGKKSFTEVNVPTGFTLPQYIEFAEAMGQLIANISKAQLTSASVNINLTLAGATLKAAATIIADVAEKAHYVFSSAAAGFRKLFKIPTRAEDDEVAGSDAMNTADADQAAFIAAINNGLVWTSGTIQFTDNYGNDLVALESARSVLMTTA